MSGPMLCVVTVDVPDPAPVVVLPVFSLAEKLLAVLERLPLVGTARDGDCLLVAPRVTTAVQEIGIPAETVELTGWLNPTAVWKAFPELRPPSDVDDQKIFSFGHQITVAVGWVLDATARQFCGDLPARWIAPIGEYLQRLAAVTGVAEVTVAYPDRACEAEETQG